MARIVAGEQVARTPELLTIAGATGTAVAALTGAGMAPDAVTAMRTELITMLKLHAYLEDQAIPTTV